MRGSSRATWPDPREQPPIASVELDLNHPLAQGMIACWLHTESVTKDFGPRGNTGTRVGTGVSLAAGGHGVGASFTGGSGLYINTVRSKTDDLTGALTVAQKIVTRGSFINHRNTLYRGDATNGQFGIITFSDGHWESESGAGISGGVMTLNKDYSIGYTLTGAGGTLTTYTNGAPIVTGLRTASFKNNDCTIGGDAVNSRWHNGLIYYTYLYNRALPTGLMLWLHEEPYAMFQLVV